MVKESLFYKMDNIMKENFTKVISTVKEDTDGRLEMCILVTSNMTSEKDSELMNGDKETIIEGNGTAIG